MGKNLYETPRDRGKWKTGSKLPNKTGVKESNNAPTIDELKVRYKQQKEAKKRKK